MTPQGKLTAALTLALSTSGCQLFVPLDDYVGEAPEALVDGGGPSESDASIDEAETAHADGESSVDSAPSDDAGAERDGGSLLEPDGSSLDSAYRDTSSDTMARADADANSPAKDAAPPKDATAPPKDATAPPKDAATIDSGCKMDCGVVSKIGCSDGTREAFVAQTTFPEIAGCVALWTAHSMRDPKTGVTCGNSSTQQCGAPADACANGWHVCAIPPYGAQDITGKITADQCNDTAIKGAFAAGISDQNCDACLSGAGNGAACCGDQCVNQKGSCVFANATRWFGMIGSQINACADIVASYANEGVLCCRDP